MLALVIICVVFFFKEGSTLGCEAENQYDWSLHGTTNDPVRWPKRYPVCGYKGNSPIEISTIKANGNFPRLVYKNFNKPVTNATVENKGWAVIVTPKDGVERTVRFRGRAYTLEELRFHFLSEHVIDNVRHDMEIQFVCKQPDSMFARGVVSSLMKEVNQANKGLEPIVEIVPKLLYRGDSSGLQSELQLTALLPKNSGSFYTYDGSNTVPPCDKGYTWYILKDIGNVGKDDMNTFKTLYSVGKADASDKCRMYPNVRPLCRDENLDIRKSN